jgi:hypothetical protein
VKAQTTTTTWQATSTVTQPVTAVYPNLLAGKTTIFDDTVAPTVSISAPLNNSTVSGIIKLAVMASDNVGVSQINWYVNDLFVGQKLSDPLTIDWDSRTIPNGKYNMTAIAWDGSKNSTTSTLITVNVQNGMQAVTSPTLTAVQTPATETKITTTSTAKISPASFGDKSENVKRIQQYIKDAGYFTGNITGYYGKLTAAGVYEFQKANNIGGGDGQRVGPLTISAFQRGGFSITPRPAFSDITTCRR